MWDLFELYCVVIIKHIAFFTIWSKLTVAFTCTSLPLTFILLFSVVVLELKARFGGFGYPYSPPSLQLQNLKSSDTLLGPPTFTSQRTWFAQLAVHFVAKRGPQDKANWCYSHNFCPTPASY